MNNLIKNTKKAVLTLAIALTTTASAFAQIYWTGTQTLQPGQVINDNIILTGNVTLEIASGAATINGSISGGFSVTKNGSGSLVLTSPNNSYSGATTINGGYFRLSDGGNLTNTSGVIVASGRLEFFDQSNQFTFTRVISGAGGILVSSNNKVTLTAVNTYTGGTSISIWTVLQVGNGTSGSISNTSGVYLSSDNACIRFEPGANMTFDKVISGEGRLEYKGDDTKRLLLTAANPFLGTTTVETGRFEVHGSHVSKIILQGSSMVVFSHSSAYTYSGVISGSGTVHKIGAGTLTFNGVNTYTGGTVVWQGPLALGTYGTIENSAHVNLSDAAAKLNISAGNKTIKGIQSDSNSEVVLGNSRLFLGNAGINDGGGTFAGRFTGTGSIDKRGNAMLTLSGASTYSGNTDIHAGSILFSNLNNFGTSSLHLYGGTIAWNAGNTADISSRIASINNGANVTFHTGANNVTFATGLPTTTANITKDGAGKLTMTAANNNSGTLTVAVGTLQIGNGTSGSMNNIASISVAQGAVIRFEPGDHLSLNKVVSGAGSLEYRGSVSKSLRLNAANTYTGRTFNEFGDLYIGDGATGSVAGNIENNSTLYFARTNDYTYSGVISGTGSLYIIGGGKTTLTGVNTYTGLTSINNGTLQIGNGSSGSINNTSAINIVNSNCVLRFEPGEDMIINKVISGTGSVQYKGAIGTKRLIYTANMTYTGTTTIETDGDMGIGNVGTTGSIVGNVINHGEFVFRRTDPYTYSGVISGTGMVCAAISAPSITFTAVHTYTGPTLVRGGLILSASASIENSSQVYFNDNGGKFDVTSGNKKIKALHTTGNLPNAEVALGSSTLTIGTSGQDDGNGNFSGKFTGTGGVIKTGTGILTVSGANTATGAFRQEAGTIAFASIWKGNYNKLSGAAMTIIGYPEIEGNFMLAGGDFNMDLMDDTPPKLVVMGAVSASGNNMLNITADGEVTNQLLIQAFSGISIEPFSVNMPGFDAVLTAPGGTQLLLTATINDDFIPVTNITDVPTEITVGNPLFLSGTVYPDDATYQTIIFSVLDEGTTDATITDNTLYTKDEGVVVVLATIINGLAIGEDYTQEFTITVYSGFIPVTSITNVPDEATIGTLLLLTGTVEPSIATNQTIIFSVLDEGTTGATITDNTLITTDEGIVIVLATIIDGLAIGEDYTQEFEILVKTVGVDELRITNYELGVFPNPTNGVLNIVGAKYFSPAPIVEIFDMTGRRVGANLRVRPDNTIDITHLPAGIYFLRIDNQRIKIVKK